MNMEVVRHHSHHHHHHHHHHHQDSSGFENAVQQFADEAPGDLLEKSWFFGNSLERKTKMIRCHSDPCPSSKVSDGRVGKSFEETYESLQKLPSSCSSGNLMRRTPSLPVESSRSLSKGVKSRPPPAPAPPPPARFNLSRAPSLPSTLTNNEEIHDEEESEFSMSKLIRQASLKTPEKASPLPPRRIPKAAGLSSSAPPRNRLRRKTDAENWKTESSDQGKSSSAKLGRSSSDAFGEINKGFKDMSLKSESQDCLGQSDGEEPKKVHSSGHERWKKLQRSVSSSMEKKSAEDMKAQIKFWARAVASNVRQEC